MGGWEKSALGETIGIDSTRLSPYSWKNSWARMRFGLEWFNFTISREALTADACSAAAMSCKIDYAPAIFAPNLSLHADIQ